MLFIFPRMASSGPKRLLFLWASFSSIYVKATPTPTRTTSSPATSATGLSLSSDVTNFIPSCALSCFKSFVEINYNVSVCGISPSLECLCQHTGSTGYTIGEGATECIVAENNINKCRNSGFGSPTVTAAYGMCNNITNAAPETHATLVATLIVNSGSIVLASPTTTPSTNHSSTSTSAVTTPTSAVTTPTQISSSTSSARTTVAPAAATSTTAAATTASTAPQLTQAQIGGLAAGIAAAAVLAGLLALFIILLRRRRRGGAHRGASPAFSRMRDSWSPKRTQHGSPGSGSGSGSLSISQPRYHEPKVMSFTRALAKRISSSRPTTRRPGGGPSSDVGLAITPNGSRKPGTGVGLDYVIRSPVSGGSLHPPLPPSPLMIRNAAPRSPPGPAPSTFSPPPPLPPMSPLRAVSNFDFFPRATPPLPSAATAAAAQTPTKPALARLAIPQRASTHGGAGGRDSVITEFAEDGEDGHGSALIWRPPNTDPQSATTYYVADPWGNWVLRDQRDVTPPEAIAELAELATPISKTAEERAREEEEDGGRSLGLVEESAAVKELRHHSSPTIPEAVMALSPGRKAGQIPGGEKPTIRLVTPESGRLPMNSRARSSVYSNHFSMPQQVVPGPLNPMPQPSRDEALLHRGSGGGNGSRRRRRSDGTRRLPPERQGSRDSATTIMSQDSATTTIVDSPVDDMINAVLQAFPLPSSQASASDYHHQQQNQQQGDLSPVLESPGGSSLVRYPAIPRSQSITVNKRRNVAPRPLPNPVLAKIKQGAVQPLKDSPTLGVNALSPATYSQKPPQGNLVPHAADRRKPSGGGGAPTRTVSPLSQTHHTRARKPSDIALLPSQSHHLRSSSRPQMAASYDAYNDPSSSMMYANQPPQGYHHRPPPPEHHHRTTPPSPGQAYGSPPPPSQPYLPSPPSSSAFEAQPQPQPHDIRSTTKDNNDTNPSMNSALLAKRLGAERAAEFRRINQQQRHAQEREKWARQNAGGDEIPALPATPGWKPQLTPKRKGDDLYLSVG